MCFKTVLSYSPKVWLFHVYLVDLILYPMALAVTSQAFHVCLLSSLCFQSDGFLKDNNNAAQRLLDGVNYISQSVTELSVKPAKAVTSWLTDQIAPAYWKPNSAILVYS